MELFPFINILVLQCADAAYFIVYSILQTGQSLLVIEKQAFPRKHAKLLNFKSLACFWFNIHVLKYMYNHCSFCSSHI